MRVRIIATAGIFLASVSLYAAEPVVVKLNQGALGDRVAAYDLVARDVAWEIAPCPELNFVKTTSGGILVGCEDSILLMLNAATGIEIWRRNLALDVPGAASRTKRARNKFDINKFHGEKPYGYLVSDGENYFLIRKDGQYLIRCDESCGAILMSTDLHAGKWLIMRWQNPGSNRGVAAFDVAKGKLAWEFSACTTANFAAATSTGVLVGCDDSNLILLDTASGKEIWRRDLAITERDEARRANRTFRELRINRFHAETPEGFFVSSADVVYLLIAKKGDQLMRCDKLGCVRSPTAGRDEQATKR